jgi:hypothetical protein
MQGVPVISEPPAAQPAGPNRGRTPGHMAVQPQMRGQQNERQHLHPLHCAGERLGRAGGGAAAAVAMRSAGPCSVAVGINPRTAAARMRAVAMCVTGIRPNAVLLGQQQVPYRVSGGLSTARSLARSASRCTPNSSVPSSAKCALHDGCTLLQAHDAHQICFI